MKKFGDFLAAEGTKVDASTNLRQLAISRPGDFMRFRCTVAADFLRDMRQYARTIKPGALVECISVTIGGLGEVAGSGANDTGTIKGNSGPNFDYLTITPANRDFRMGSRDGPVAPEPGAQVPIRTRVPVAFSLMRAPVRTRSVKEADYPASMAL